ELPKLGKKTGPFAGHLDPTQVSPSTSVNDIWHARAFGFTDKDGSLFDRALTPQEHAFLDSETLLAADRANKANLGGFSDWGSGNVQASAWVGAKAQKLMADNPGMSMEDALNESKVDFSDVLQKHTAAGTYERVPGAGTGHAQALITAPYGERQAYSAQAPWTNPEGQDILYRSTGMYQRPTQEAQGYFTPKGSKTPEVNPAFVARPLIDYVPGKGGPEPSPVSRGTLDAVEATRAYMDAQAMGAHHKLLTSGRVGDMGAVTIPGDRALSPEEMTSLGKAVQPYGLSPSDTAQGVSLLNFGEGPKPGPELRQQLQPQGGLQTAIQSVLPGSEGMRARQFSNALMVDKNGNPLLAAKNEGTGKATRALFKTMDNPDIPAIAGKLDSPELRQQAQALLQRDEDYATRTGDPIRADIQNARRVLSESGLEGLRAALKAGKIPLPAVAGLGLTGLLGAEFASGGQAQAAQAGERTMNVDPQAARRHMIAQMLAQQGRGGDSMLAHLSPAEMTALKLMGGAGTTNPHTGLPEFQMSGGGPPPGMTPGAAPAFLSQPAGPPPGMMPGPAPNIPAMMQGMGVPGAAQAAGMAAGGGGMGMPPPGMMPTAGTLPPGPPPGTSPPPATTGQPPQQQGAANRFQPGPQGSMANRPDYFGRLRGQIQQAVASQGRGGDTQLAHLSPSAMGALRRRGGAGTTNPETGLPEFFGGGYGHASGDTNAGGAGSLGDSGGYDAAGNSLSGGALRDVTGMGSGVLGDLNDAISGANIGPGAVLGHLEGSPTVSGGGNLGLPGGASGAYNSKAALEAKDPITSAALANQADYANVGNSLLDRIGNFAASQLGFNEIDPTTMDQKALAAGTVPQTQADWGFDPAGLIGGAAGTALGVPGL
ncbi:MAG TPA: hypothetical protein VGH25_05700, partial [Dongiaceae bacterium]